MRLLLFAGFLGSGKTTLILALGRQAAFRDARVAVIVNEVGEVGIDGDVLRMGDLQVKEITAGCICCQIGVDLVRTLRELEELFRPDLVIIEASGIATPAGVLDALQRYPVETVTSIETITVVDPLRFEALYEVLTPLIESQIVGADRVVVMKVDQATPDEVDAALRTVAALAPFAPTYLVDAAREDSVEPLLAALGLAVGAGGRGAPARAVRPPSRRRERGRACPAPGRWGLPALGRRALSAFGGRSSGAVWSPGGAPSRATACGSAAVPDHPRRGSGRVDGRRRSFRDRSCQVSASRPRWRAYLQSHLCADGRFGRGAGRHHRSGSAADRRERRAGDRRARLRSARREHRCALGGGTSPASGTGGGLLVETGLIRAALAGRDQAVSTVVTRPARRALLGGPPLGFQRSSHFPLRVILCR